MNFYLLDDPRDPGGQLGWLEERLRELEKIGEHAVIIGHIPPSVDECLYEWSKRFSILMERFQHVVRLNLYGHVHSEIQTTYRSYEEHTPFMTEFWTGSVTTFTGRNPSFRVITIDSETKLPVDMQTYFFNVTKANVDRSPEWELLYDFLPSYGVEDLSPASIYSLGERVVNDEELGKRINLNYVAYGPDVLDAWSDDQSKCDEECRKKIGCRLQNGVYFEYKDCLGEPRYDLIHDTGITLFEYLLGGTWWTLDDEE